VLMRKAVPTVPSAEPGGEITPAMLPLLKALADLEHHHRGEIERLRASGCHEDLAERIEHQMRERHRRECAPLRARLDAAGRRG